MGHLRGIRKSDQAHEISAWIAKEEDDDLAWVAVNNGSSFQISKVILSTVNVQGKASKGVDAPNGYRSYLSIVPPGIYYTRIQIQHGMSFLSGLEIAFLDKEGQGWVRDGDGIIIRIKQFPYEYYEIPLPISWEQPKDRMT